MMNREEAAEELGISVRSLQRVVKAGLLSVTYKRGASGKQEAFFDPDEIMRHKATMQAETVKPALAPAGATNGDTALARVGAPQIANALMSWLEGKQREQEGETDGRQARPSVAIADKPLLKLDEASALTGLSRHILREAIDAGKLKAKIIGRSWRVKREDLDNYIKKL